MEGLLLFILLIAFHIILFCTDGILRSCSHLPYMRLLQETGLEINFLRLRWYTTGLNRSFQRWSQWKPHIQAIWFSMGVICSLLLMPVAAFLVLRGLFASTSDEATGAEPSGFELEPVVPGVNLPLSQLGNYMTALAVSGVLHEMGHAMAAAREGVPVIGCGAQLLLMLPIASVELSTQRLVALPWWRRLRVLCAGVWHNVVLGLLSLLLWHALTFSPAYSLGKGMVVTHVTQGSGIAGPAGLKAGDHVTGVDNYVVTNSLSWQRSLIRSARMPQSSYCVPSSFLSAHKPRQDGQPCCEIDVSRHLCFTGLKSRWCLKARDVIEVAGNKSPPCLGHDDIILTPDLGEDKNTSRLIVIQRSNFQRPAVLFLGSPKELLSTVKTSDWLPAIAGLPPRLPEILTSACSYVAALSAGLALLNLLPCYGFDGQHIINLLLEQVFASCGVRNTLVASTVSAGFTAVGTGCLLAWLTTAMWKLFPVT